MADDFDPYYTWLGISPKDQPPTHYRLLGIDLFESNLDVIEHAADRQMAHLRLFQSGPQGEWSQKLLNEIASAKLCLLNPAKKAEYDERLRAAQRNTEATARPRARPLRASPIPESAPAADPGTPFDEGIDITNIRAARTTPPGRQGHASSSETTELPTKRKKKNAVVESIKIVLGAGVGLSIGYYILMQLGHDFLGLGGKPSGRVAGGSGESRKSADATTAKVVRSFDEPAAASEIKGKSVEPESTIKPRDPAEPKKPLPEPKKDVEHNKDTQPMSKTTDMTPAVGLLNIQRRPVPRGAELDEARGQVSEMLPADFASLSTEIKATTVRNFLRRASQSEDSDVVRYALLVEAREIAMQVVEVELLTEANVRLTEEFEIDYAAQTHEMLARLASANVPANKRSHVIQALFDATDEVVADEQFARASELAELALKTAGKFREQLRQATVRRDRVAQLGNWAMAAEAAAATLAKNPDDASANGAIGLYRCFVLDQWVEGLKLLAKSDNVKLRAAAHLDGLNPTEADSQMNVGDAWWEAGSEASGSARLFYQQRSRHWYLQSVPGLGATAKDTIEKRLAILDKALADAPSIDRDKMKSAERKLAAVVAEKIKYAIDQRQTVRSARIGGDGGNRAFSFLPEEGAVLIGMDGFLREDGIIRGIRFIFLTQNGELVTDLVGGEVGQTFTERAPKGYAVSGIEARAARLIDGFRLVYDPIRAPSAPRGRGKTLYGEWRGGSKGGKWITTRFEGFSVIGVSGMRGNVVDSLNLIGVGQVVTSAEKAAPKKKSKIGN